MKLQAFAQVGLMYLMELCQHAEVLDSSCWEDTPSRLKLVWEILPKDEIDRL